MKLFVGIDVSSEKLDVCFLDSDGVIHREASLSNCVLGAYDIKNYVLKFHQLYGYKRIVIGMESTSVYSQHPATLLHEDDELNALGIVEVVVQNPLAIKRYANIFDEDKTDKIDAMRIAEFLSMEKFNTSIIREEKFAALQRLTRSRLQLITQLTECKMHFLENLYYKCNTLVKELKEDSNSSVFGASLMDILTDSLSLDQIASMELEDLATLLQNKGRGRFKDPEKLAKTIQRAIRNSYRLGDMMQDSVNTVLAMYAEMIKALKKQIKLLDQSIERLIQTIPEADCLRSIPGIGPVYAAGIIAEIGQIDRFDDDTKIAKYAGLYWKKKQSGNYESQRTPLTRTGNRHLRYYLIEAANSVKMREPVYKDYYNKKYAEVPKHQHKRALVLTARKLVRLVDTLLRNRQLYAPERSG
jgi:transposase